jgi:stage II sporulation protein AA (anti-sigma F factor antagonist)
VRLVEGNTYPAPGSPAVLSPAGRLDASAAPRLRQDIGNLLDQGIVNVVVNLSQVPYLSSSILRVLLTAHKQARQAGGALAICCLQPQIMRVISLVGFDQILAICDTEAQAIATVRSASHSRASGKEKP